MALTPVALELVTAQVLASAEGEDELDHPADARASSGAAVGSPVRDAVGVARGDEGGVDAPVVIAGGGLFGGTTR